MDIYKGSREDEWGTPQDLIKRLGLVGFFDVCASKENAKFSGFFTKEDNALEQDWPWQCWMNPPFSQAKAFFLKAVSEAAKGVKVVAIYKSTNLETSLWQDVILPSADGILFLRGRTEYERSGEKKKGVPFGSAVIFFNCEFNGGDMSGGMGFYVKLRGAKND